MRTLVVHTGGIGDFLLACPSVRALSEAGRVELLGYPARLSLAVDGRIADAAHDIDTVDLGSLFSTPSRKLRTFLSLFDRIIVWMRDDDQAVRNGLKQFGIDRIDVHPGLPPENWAQHASEYYLECLGLSDAQPLRLEIGPSAEALDVLIHPGSGSPAKNWPLENFLELGKYLETEGRQVTWCLGPAERESAEFSALFRQNVLEVESLTKLAARLANARLYIGNDSGITHIAAALGCRTIAIFGPSDPAVWAPLGGNVRVLKGSPWPDGHEIKQLLQQVDAKRSSRKPSKDD